MACTNHPSIVEGIVRCVRCRRQFCPDCVVYLRGFPYCATCKAEQVLDVQSGVRTTRLDFASVWARLGARILDGLLVGVVMAVPLVPLVIAAAALGGAAGNEQRAAAIMGLVQIAILPFALGIPLVYEALMLKSRGQTLGKMALGIKVVTPEGSDISGGQAWGRTAFHVAMGFCTCLGPMADLLPGLFTEEKTCLHDIVAKTRVVRFKA